MKNKTLGLDEHFTFLIAREHKYSPGSATMKGQLCRARRPLSFSQVGKGMEGPWVLDIFSGKKWKLEEKRTIEKEV